MKNLNRVAIAVSAALLTSAAGAVDFNGYMRAGTGLSGNNGENISFEKNKIGRLGNENDLYAEFGFRQELPKIEGMEDQKWVVDAMIAQGNSGNNGWEDGDFNVAQFNVQATGLIASDKEATLWAGKRYYQRKDIHITDFYYLNTSAGAGGGIENLSVGPGKLSAAWMLDEGTQETANGIPQAGAPSWANDTQVNGNIFDVRYSGLNLWNNATLELAGVYNFANEKEKQTITADDGVMLTAILQQGLSNGFNQTVLQYGTSSYGAQMADLGSGAWFDRSGEQNDANGYRVINWGVMSFGDKIEVGHQLMYAASTDASYGDGITGSSVKVKGDHSLMSAVVRPMYKWNQNMKTILELGVFSESYDGRDDKGGSKATIAQAWSMGDSFWARPELRVFASYITDDEGTTLGSSKGDSDYSIGMQVEAWF
ncbi:maltoporin LamB [Moritella sp. F3]|uniref:maltoporin LamB n=1 Tax=Moritella sp. F3 TaxID=2718882 RepID=UPI0018E139CD|nr:maltoporin LamB [Moritella sp. F3]GIC78753.1 maltoporin [Moritella sp. F1]GIC82644.1 maltoporin [Moritella sp. F3]